MITWSINCHDFFIKLRRKLIVRSILLDFVKTFKINLLDQFLDSHFTFLNLIKLTEAAIRLQVFFFNDDSSKLAYFMNWFLTVLIYRTIWFQEWFYVEIPCIFLLVWFIFSWHLMECFLVKVIMTKLNLTSFISWLQWWFRWSGLLMKIILTQWHLENSWITCVYLQIRNMVWWCIIKFVLAIIPEHFIIIFDLLFSRHATPTYISVGWDLSSHCKIIKFI